MNFENFRLLGFHFNQAVVRKSKKLGLWNASAEAKSKIKMSFSLPLLPHNRVASGIEVIEEAQPAGNQSWASFIRYLQNWQAKGISVHGQSMRTNNNVEAFNRTLGRVAGHEHPNIWALVVQLRLLENNAAVDLTRAANGLQRTARRKICYKQLDVKIRAAWTRLEEDGDIGHFLRHMAHAANDADPEPATSDDDTEGDMGGNENADQINMDIVHVAPIENQIADDLEQNEFVEHYVDENNPHPVHNEQADVVAEDEPVLNIEPLEERDAAMGENVPAAEST